MEALKEYFRNIFKRGKKQNAGQKVNTTLQEQDKQTDNRDKGLVYILKRLGDN